MPFETYLPFDKEENHRIDFSLSFKELTMGIQEGKRIVNLRTLKKAGIIVAGVSATAIVTIMLLAIFRNGGNGGFTVKIDNPSRDNHIYMTESLNGNNTVLLSGKPIEKMYPTTAEKVENYLSEFNVNDIGGEHNMPDPNESRPDYFNALVFTVFLTNYDESEEQKITYEVNLDSYVAPSNGAQSTYDYMRVMVQTSIVEGDSLSKSLDTTYFASPSHSNYGTTISGEDNRECVSSWDNTMDENSFTVRKSEYVGLSKDGFCENFLEDKNNNVLASQELVIQPKQTMRFTFVSYLEGQDPDCKSYSPDSSVLLMSLHFGQK